MHADRGWGEGIVGWEEESSPVLTALVRRRWRASEDIVPFEDVGF